MASRELVRVDNPYWWALRDHPNDELFMRMPLYPTRAQFAQWFWEYDALGNRIGLDTSATYMTRDDAVRIFAWAIPDPIALRYVAHKLNGRGMVEVGAGTGYWAYVLGQYGVDVVPYDLEPPDPWSNNWWHPDARQWTHVYRGGPEVVSMPIHRDRALFLCWPPYDKPMAYEALVDYPGDIVVYIGESHGGCTADDDFHERLEKDFEEESWFPLCQWAGIHDNISIWRRRK